MNKRLLCSLFALMCLIPLFSANRALIVGIGNYDTKKTGWSKLHGDKDVQMLSKALRLQGFDHILTLSNEQATKSNIITYLKQLANECQSGDKVFFSFSGHGQLIQNFNGDVEKNGYDESIVPYDAYKTSRYIYNGTNYNGQNHLTDDEISPLLNAIKVKIGKKGIFFVAIDACYSEGMEQDVEASYSTDDLEIMGSTRGSADVFKPVSSAYLKAIPKPEGFSRLGKMIVVSACRSNERNFEYRIPKTDIVVGSLSHCIAYLLEKDADFQAWIVFFQKKLYRGKRLFVPAQHPTITIY